jgi:hypothetical protein
MAAEVARRWSPSPRRAPEVKNPAFLDDPTLSVTLESYRASLRYEADRAVAEAPKVSEPATKPKDRGKSSMFRK